MSPFQLLATHAFPAGFSDPGEFLQIIPLSQSDSEELSQSDSEELLEIIPLSQSDSEELKMMPQSNAEEVFSTRPIRYLLTLFRLSYYFPLLGLLSSATPSLFARFSQGKGRTRLSTVRRRWRRGRSSWLSKPPCRHWRLKETIE